VVAADATLAVGVLQQTARTLSASPAAEGQTVTAYAAAYALAAPAVMRLARRARPERMLARALSLFALANAATAAAPSLAVLLVARIAAGTCAAVFMACAAAVAGKSVPARRRGRALATVVGGAALATAFGVPLGTFAAAVAGWRAVFWGVAVATALAATAASWRPLRPADQEEPDRSAAPPGGVLLILAVTLLWSTGSFTFFTYIGAVVRQTASAGPAGLAGYLLLFGLAGLAGAVASGWLADRNGPVPALAGGLTLTALSLAGMGLTAALSARPALAASIAAITGHAWARGRSRRRSSSACWPAVATTGSCCH